MENREQPMKKADWIGIILLFTMFIDLIIYLAGLAVTGKLYIPDWPAEIKNNLVGGMMTIAVIAIIVIMLVVSTIRDNDKALLKEDERDKK